MKLKTGINIQLDFLEFVSPPISYKFNTLFYMYHIVFLMLKVEHVIFSGISFLMEGGGGFLCLFCLLHYYVFTQCKRFN